MKRLMMPMIVLLLVWSSSGRAQTIHFVYFAPNATMQGAFGAVAPQVLTRVDTATGDTIVILPGYSYVEITAANRAAFNGIAAPLLRRTIDSISTATSALRRKMNPVLGISAGRLRHLIFYLVDDRTGFVNPDRRGPFTLGTVNGAQGIWPSASNWVWAGVYVGLVRLGEQAAADDVGKLVAGGFPRWESTIIHETSHTQMLSDTTGVNKWGEQGIGISYGGDAGHWFEELQADEQSAMDEGMGYFWGLEHHPPLAAELTRFLNIDTTRFLLGSHSFLTGTPGMWNAPHHVLYSGPASTARFPWGTPINLTSANLQPGSGYELRSYAWLDVPGQYVLYNENMSEAYFYLFHQYAFANRDTAYRKILNAAAVMASPNQRLRYPAHAANILANSMEAYARARPADTSLVSSMFALALYDMMGHFGRTDASLQREFTINAATYMPMTPVPRAQAEYMRRRAAVKALVCPFLSGNAGCAQQHAPIDIHRAVQAIRTYFRDPATILR